MRDISLDHLVLLVEVVKITPCYIPLDYNVFIK
jgi:hypothetical protein